ncbi:MAG: cellulose biosynthesis cyclic di-GMP-binding regulatory protein BcsB [Alphaproteobacteria bacterium]|nr:cellulose biosynthesis cyclic di-GMP-binding regulatory protein BcsB [Alphaproteobacteria bacterium]
MAPLTLTSTKTGPARRGRGVRALCRAAALLAVAALAGTTAEAQQGPSGGAAGPATAPSNASAPGGPLTPAATPNPATAQPGAAPAPVPAPPVPPATASTSSPAAPSGVGSARDETLTLKDLGANSPIRLLGVVGEGSLPFSVRRDERVSGAHLDMSLVFSPALIPDLSHLSVLLNGSVVQSVPLPKDKTSGETISLPLDPGLFKADNRLLFRFIGHYTLGCEDPLSPNLWLVLSNNSALSMQLQKVPLPNQLALLPEPFYDSKDMQALVLPFVFSSKPAPETLRAAGITASWFGSLAAYKGATFPVSFDTVPNGNAVAFATNADKPSGISIPNIDGPTISVVPNPSNPEGKLLLVMGRTPEELAAAAQTLALGAATLSGQTQVVAAPEVPARQAYDAPRWIPMNRPVHFGELVQPSDLQGTGLVPGLLTVNFRTAPDIFVWGNTGVPLVVRYRYPSGTWLNYSDSRLDVSINNSYVSTLPLSEDGTARQVRDLVSPDFTLNEQTLRVPPYYIFGQNQLQFYYQMRPINVEPCQDVLPNNVQEGIDPDSTIDLSHAERFTELPNLAYFVNSGFPFTKFADLSQTAVVLPDQVTPADVQTYLTIMGLMGDSTGYPVVRVAVVPPNAVDQVKDRDLIVLGPVSRQPLLARWGGNSRLAVDGGRLRVASNSSLDRVSGALDPNAQRERERIDQLLAQQGNNLATMLEMESPLHSGRTALFVTGGSAERQMAVLSTFRNRDQNPLIQGDMMVVTPDNKVSSFRLGSQYTVGTLNPLTRIRWWLGNSPLILILFTLVGVLMLALVLYWLLSRVAARRIAGPVP